MRFGIQLQNSERRETHSEASPIYQGAILRGREEELLQMLIELLPL